MDCQLSTWSSWIDCSTTCGGGTQHRSRVVEKVAQNGGVICSGSLVETQACNTQTCVPPQGKVTEFFFYLSVPTFLTMLNIIIIETTRCNLSFLTAVDCQFSTWSTWVDCSATCGNGTQLRSRLVEQNAENNGAPCTGSLIESQICNSQSCPSQGRNIYMFMEAMHITTLALRTLSFFLAGSYTIVTIGSSCNKITTSAECTQAANELGLKDSLHSSWSESSYAQGCVCNEGGITCGFNSYGSGRDCGYNSYNCICKSG